MRKFSQELAASQFLENGFKLIGEFNGADKPVLVEGLECGHVSKKRLSHTKRGKGCFQCAVKQRTLKRKFSQEEAKAQFFEHGYILKGKYQNARIPVLVEGIKCGHNIEVRLDNIKSGQGCKECALAEQSNRQRTPLEKLHAEIIEIGYIPLFSDFKTTRQRLYVKCKDGHPPFYAILQQLRSRKKGCPYCKFKGENLLRGYIEYILKQTSRKILVRSHKFKKFKWLELDIYFDSLNLAFEYQGHQHTEFPNRYDKSIDEFNSRQLRDKAKREYCKEKGILLIEIFEKATLTDLPNCIRNKFKDGLDTHPHLAKYLKVLRGSKIDDFALKTSMLEKLKDETIKKNGKCHSKVWLGVMEKYIFSCNVCGHKWKSTANKIYQGRWCPKCANRNRNKNNRKEIIQMSLDGKIIKRWESISLAKESFSNSISSCLSGITKTAHGYRWEYSKN